MVEEILPTQAFQITIKILSNTQLRGGSIGAHSFFSIGSAT
jgi:hypothetical protein